jgi:arylsulfatase B
MKLSIDASGRISLRQGIGKLIALVSLPLIIGCGGGGGSSTSGATAATVPGSPTITAAVAGDGIATISFSAPNSNGGSTVSQYTINCNATISMRSTTGTSSPMIVSALTNGTTYTCTASATNSVGTSPASVAVTVTPVAPVSAQTPNILFVIADDFGVDASPCHTSIGAIKPNMPNLLALCQRGLVLDNAWAHPTCTPTRASVLSGQYGIRTNVMQVDDVLATTTPTILQRLAQGTNPYAVAVIGKWHVSGATADANSPDAHGATHYAGFLTGALTDYFDWRITVNGVSSRTTTYATTALTDQAISWIANRQQPWFLWLAYNAPHSPFHTPPEHLHTQTGLKNGSATDDRTKYFAAAEAMDTELGRLIASIPTAVMNNTTIVFMGDNGTPASVIQTPFSRTKAKDTLYQGGIQVPLVVAGSGVSRIGQREQALVNSVDLFATIANLAQRTSAIPADSLSFFPALTSSTFAGRTHAYIDSRQSGEITTAIRDSRYKLIEGLSARRELYDLSTDPYESTDLLASGSNAALDLIVNALVAQRANLQR